MTYGMTQAEESIYKTREARVDLILAGLVFVTHGVLDTLVTFGTAILLGGSLHESNPLWTPYLNNAAYYATAPSGLEAFRDLETILTWLEFLAVPISIKLLATAIGVAGLIYARRGIPRRPWRYATGGLAAAGLIVTVNNLNALWRLLV
jgi:hypothetical protein